MILGCDISDFQPDADFQQAKSTIGFCYSKATEGLMFTADTFAKHHDAAKSAGVPFGSYHYLHAFQDGEDQAKHFLEATDGRLGTLVPMVDVERGYNQGATPEQIIDALSAFLVEVERVTLRPCLIYTGWSFWNDSVASDAFSGHPLWVAAYNNDDAPPLPKGWKSAAIWQYTDSLNVPGIGSVDGDKLLVPLSDILR